MANSTGCGPLIRWLPFSKWLFRKSKSPIFCWDYLVKAHQKHKYSFGLRLPGFTSLLLWFCYLGEFSSHSATSCTPPSTIPLGRPSAPAPSIQYHASSLDWWFVSYMILYMFFYSFLFLLCVSLCVISDVISISQILSLYMFKQLFNLPIDLDVGCI